MGVASRNRSGGALGERRPLHRRAGAVAASLRAICGGLPYSRFEGRRMLAGKAKLIDGRIGPSAALSGDSIVSPAAGSEPLQCRFCHRSRTNFRLAQWCSLRDIERSLDMAVQSSHIIDTRKHRRVAILRKASGPKSPQRNFTKPALFATYEETEPGFPDFGTSRSGVLPVPVSNFSIFNSADTFGLTALLCAVSTHVTFLARDGLSGEDFFRSTFVFCRSGERSGLWQARPSNAVG